jgi:hypothetical protein
MLVALVNPIGIGAGIETAVHGVVPQQPKYYPNGYKHQIKNDAENDRCSDFTD